MLTCEKYPQEDEIIISRGLTIPQRCYQGSLEIYFKQNYSVRSSVIQKQCSLWSLFPSASMNNSSPLTEAAHWLICSNGGVCLLWNSGRRHVSECNGICIQAGNICDRRQGAQCMWCRRSVYYVACMCAWRTRVLCGRSNHGITWVVGCSLRRGIHGGRMDGEEGACRFIFSSHYFILIFLHMSGGKGVSVCLVSICMHEAIPLIHRVSPSPIRWRMGDSIHIFMDADGFSVVLSFQFCLGISEG